MKIIEKSCSNCKNHVEFPPPHTCDICTSLDQEEDYGMWEYDESNESVSDEPDLGAWLDRIFGLISTSYETDRQELMSGLYLVARKLGYRMGYVDLFGFIKDS